MKIRARHRRMRSTRCAKPMRYERDDGSLSEATFRALVADSIERLPSEPILQSPSLFGVSDDESPRSDAGLALGTANCCRRYRRIRRFRHRSSRAKRHRHRHIRHPRCCRPTGPNWRKISVRASMPLGRCLRRFNSGAMAVQPTRRQALFTLRHFQMRGAAASAVNAAGLASLKNWRAPDDSVR